MFICNMIGIISEYQQDPESQSYKACSYRIDGIKIIERTAKITPKKIGHFVTCWKRNTQKITQPFDAEDAFDFFIINVEAANGSGYFKFPKKVLIDQGIVSSDKKPGKRGFRVYPSWDKVSSAQALKTQTWQLVYFTSNHS